TVAAVALNLIGIDPIRALFMTAIINGLVAPPLLVLIVLLGTDRGIMGKRSSGWVSRSLTWTATAVMSVAAVALLTTLVRRWVARSATRVHGAPDRQTHRHAL